ncbi:hypothetical protein [Microbacterium sp. SSM24]|uniref:hypothetical protein n=1 Tax=Microbacterium sp. SSM24 TaxID=2991714 RepID=UPI002227A4B7|nr:hypothetical protein [Microbacterium sp. SSM24]MCW3492392.1 hypothetical protein [Microbacterium sp. SSM24]
MLSSDPTPDQLKADLRSIGNWPRVVSLGWLAVIVVVTLAVGYQWWWGAIIAVWVCLFALALRVRASWTMEEFVVRSYLRTYRFRFENVVAFTDLPYQGWWSGFVPAELFGVGAYQIDVAMRGRGGRSLPATMCGRRRSVRIADALNALVPDA